VSNFRNMWAPFMWILKKKYDYWWKKYGLEKTDMATKTSLFDRHWAISLKPRRRSRPLRLVWWALGHSLFIVFFAFLSSLLLTWSLLTLTRELIDMENISLEEHVSPFVILVLDSLIHWNRCTWYDNKWRLSSWQHAKNKQSLEVVSMDDFVFL